MVVPNQWKKMDRLEPKRIITYLLNTYYVQGAVIRIYLYIINSHINPLKCKLHEARDFDFFTMLVDSCR